MHVLPLLPYIYTTITTSRAESICFVCHTPKQTIVKATKQKRHFFVHLVYCAQLEQYTKCQCHFCSVDIQFENIVHGHHYHSSSRKKSNLPYHQYISLMEMGICFLTHKLNLCWWMVIGCGCGNVDAFDFFKGCERKHVKV